MVDEQVVDGRERGGADSADDVDDGPGVLRGEVICAGLVLNFAYNRQMDRDRLT